MSAGKKGTLRIKRRGSGSGAKRKAQTPGSQHSSFGTTQERSGVSSPAPGSPRNPERRKPAEPFDITALSQPQYSPEDVQIPDELTEAPEKILSRWRADLEIFRTLPGGEEVALHGAIRSWMKSAGCEAPRAWEELRAAFREWRGSR